MAVDDQRSDNERGLGARSLFLALALVGGFAVAIYLLLDQTRSAALISYSFLLILPTALAALLCYLSDLSGERTFGYYQKVIWIFAGLLLATSLLVLREGTICVLMLMPLWMPCFYLGAWLTYRGRSRRGGAQDRIYCSSLIALPLAALLIEPAIPLPLAEVDVTRSRIVAASPATLWPLLEGIPDVRPGEGQWNLSQDVIGIPRPHGAKLVGSGLGAQRLARWDDGIAFRETIDRWQPGREIGWRFQFDDFRGWEMTDRHLLPDTPTFKVVSGYYRMEPVDARHTRLTLTTRYRIRTPVNAYARWWGERILGDLHDNLLALVAHRAEA